MIIIHLNRSLAEQQEEFVTLCGLLCGSGSYRSLLYIMIKWNGMKSTQDDAWHLELHKQIHGNTNTLPSEKSNEKFACWIWSKTSSKKAYKLWQATLYMGLMSKVYRAFKGYFCDFKKRNLLVLFGKRLVGSEFLSDTGVEDKKRQTSASTTLEITSQSKISWTMPTSMIFKNWYKEIEWRVEHRMLAFYQVGTNLYHVMFERYLLMIIQARFRLMNIFDNIQTISFIFYFTQKEQFLPGWDNKCLLLGTLKCNCFM